MGVHARQGFNIQPHPATGHLGRVDITRRPPLTPPEGENSDIAEEKAINTYYPLFSLTINRRNYSSREVCKLPPFGGRCEEHRLRRLKLQLHQGVLA